MFEELARKNNYHIKELLSDMKTLSREFHSLQKKGCQWHRIDEDNVTRFEYSGPFFRRLRFKRVHRSYTKVRELFEHCVDLTYMMEKFDKNEMFSKADLEKIIDLKNKAGRHFKGGDELIQAIQERWKIETPDLEDYKLPQPQTKKAQPKTTKPQTKTPETKNKSLR